MSNEITNNIKTNRHFFKIKNLVFRNSEDFINFILSHLLIIAIISSLLKRILPEKVFKIYNKKHLLTIYTILPMKILWYIYEYQLKDKSLSLKIDFISLLIYDILTFDYLLVCSLLIYSLIEAEILHSSVLVSFEIFLTFYFIDLSVEFFSFVKIFLIIYLIILTFKLLATINDIEEIERNENINMPFNRRENLIYLL